MRREGRTPSREGIKGKKGKGVWFFASPAGEVESTKGVEEKGKRGGERKKKKKRGRRPGASSKRDGSPV